MYPFHSRFQDAIMIVIYFNYWHNGPLHITSLLSEDTKIKITEILLNLAQRPFRSHSSNNIWSNINVMRPSMKKKCDIRLYA